MLTGPERHGTINRCMLVDLPLFFKIGKKEKRVKYITPLPGGPRADNFGVPMRTGAYSLKRTETYIGLAD